MSGHFDVQGLYQSLDNKRETLGLTWSGVASEIREKFTKVSVSTIKNIGHKQNIEGDGVLQMLLWLERSPESFVIGMESDKRHQLHPPEQGVLRWHSKKIYQLLNQRRLDSNLTWTAVAAEIEGYTPAMLTRLSDGGRVALPGIMQVVRWLEVPAASLTFVSPR